MENADIGQIEDILHVRYSEEIKNIRPFLRLMALDEAETGTDFRAKIEDINFHVSRHVRYVSGQNLNVEGKNDEGVNKVEDRGVLSR